MRSCTQLSIYCLLSVQHLQWCNLSYSLNANMWQDGLDEPAKQDTNTKDEEQREIIDHCTCTEKRHTENMVQG